jgi:hypothetical protein
MEFVQFHKSCGLRHCLLIIASYRLLVTAVSHKTQDYYKFYEFFDSAVIYVR